MNPLISICLLTYCHEKYIKDCLINISNQTYKNIELIIYDDLSKDNTRKVIQSFCDENKDRFERIELLFPEYNSGNIAKNCNEMIRRAKGKYIKLFSGDDIMTIHCLESLESAFESNPSAGLVYSNGYIVGDTYSLKSSSPNTFQDVFFSTSHFAPKQKEQLYKMLIQNYIPAPTILIKREIYIKYGLHNECLKFEDYEYWVRISQYEEFIYVKDKTVFYRKAENSVTTLNQKNCREKIISMMIEDGKVINMYIKYLNEKQKYDIKCNYYTKYLKMAEKRKINQLKYSLYVKLYFLKKENKYKNLYL